MKILHLITGLERGGAETMLAKLVRQMAPDRFESVVVSLGVEGSVGRELRQAGIAVHALDMRRSLPSLAAFLRLLRIIRRERPALLQTWLYHADLVGLLAAALTPGLPLLWNLRCSDMELANYSRRTAWVRGILARCSHRPTAVIVNSAAGQRVHAALGYRPRRWELIPNGFDTARFRPDAAARADWRRRLGIGEGETLIGMVARVDPMKDHATFLAAAARLAAARGDVRFALVGRGTEALRPEAPLAGRLQALGEQSDVAAILPAFDLLVLSSAFGEGFPNVIGEAMASGVCCIASDVGDASDDHRRQRHRRAAARSSRPCGCDGGLASTPGGRAPTLECCRAPPDRRALFDRKRGAPL